MGKIRFISGGFLTTVQDLGRFGYQQFGMPVSGAMDSYSLQLANWLTGNPRFEACFEITFFGPEIEFLTDAAIALSGGTIDATVNDQSVSMNQTHFISKGDVLKTGKVVSGTRTYLSVSGGINVPEVMGSKSTYLRGVIGGFQGRKLAAGDALKIGSPLLSEKRVVKADFLQHYPDRQTLRIIPGTEVQRFTLEGIQTFLTETFTIGHLNDRMGYRLSGPAIEHKQGADIISSGITTGSIQVPGHGNPIIMTVDHQTVGGYTKMAHVISVDIPKIGQMKAGDQIQFKEVTLKEAGKLLKKQEKNLQSLFSNPE